MPKEINSAHLHLKKEKEETSMWGKILFA